MQKRETEKRGNGKHVKNLGPWKLLWRKKDVRFGAAVLLAVAIFALGWAYGSGRINLASSSSRNASLPSQLNYASVNTVYQDLKHDYDGKLTSNQLLNGIKTGLVNATGDPHSQYFTPKQARAFNHQLNGSFSGIGAQLDENSSNKLEVVAPLKASPAAKAGLKPHDIITAINGQLTSKMTIDGAVNKIRGPAGTKVSLTIVRGTKSLSINIVRSNITVPSLSSKILKGNIGYMEINQFNGGTSALAHKAALKFKNAKAKGVVLDLRDNPGGAVGAAINVSSLWLKKNKIIMQEKRGKQVIRTYKATGTNPLLGIPTVVLINQGTASAAEITTGALHDNGAAYVIGQKSYGKGSVQEVLNLKAGAELKITIYHWYRPNGSNINKIGIKPDKLVKETASQLNSGQDAQLNGAINYLDASR
ncbi:MAG: S41 family peptidase [Candidatus Saccharimonadales bacterium]